MIGFLNTKWTYRIMDMKAIQARNSSVEINVVWNIGKTMT
jgi:hypothetical protein